MTTELTKLTGDDKTKQAGEFVLRGQETADEQGFRNVSKTWYDKTISYDQGRQILAEGKAQTEDIETKLKNFVPTVDDNGEFVFRLATDQREFRPTPFAIKQIANWAQTGTWLPEALMNNPSNSKGEQLFSRDRGDAETLAVIFNNGFRRLDPDKPFLFRTRTDGTLRAMLSDQYARVDNEWLITKLEEIVPDGRLSHWRGDADTIFGNLLIPDTIREEDDSDYGGMLSVGNSEIGERRISSCPSIFRAICMNGCIWGQTKGDHIKMVHRGSIDLAWLFNEIKVNLERQIPLLPQGIDRLIGTKTFGWDGDSILPLFAEVARDNKMTKRQATSLLNSYNVERQETPVNERTLFGIINSVTRAGQQFSNVDWIKMDEVGGRLSELDADGWDKLTSRAKSLSVKQVESAFATAV